MALTSGSRLGPYEILSAIGAGGMGEVYKARDTRLDRTVAIKILSADVSRDPDRRERFEREARAVAALNHPHICHLNDVGDAPNPDSTLTSPEPVRFLVMEYLEGQTLAERLLRGPLPTADVLRYGIELADALDHAHRRGLVHRDLKPGNVMITKAGAKLLDFGLSKLQPRADVLSLATATISPAGAALTVEGSVLGTFPYMAPEQLAGRDVDARSDLFAFGAMVYEIATGRRAFEGSTSATVIGAVLHTEPPPLASLQPLAPPALERVVSRCLAKDPDDRWQTARDLMLELKWIAEHEPPPVVAGERRRKVGLIASTAVAIAVLAIAAVLFRMVYVGATPADHAVVRLSFAPPDGVTMAGGTIGGQVAVSPDGQRIAFIATGPNGRQALWVRSLDSFAAQALSESDGAALPFWSPDGRFVAFFAQKKLKKVQLSGGTSQILCDAIQPRGGTWSRDGTIVFSAEAGHQLYRASAGGGAASPLPADGINDERYGPSFLPDGRHFVYFARNQQRGVYAASLDSPGAKLVMKDLQGAAYAPPGYLLTVVGLNRGARGGTLMAYPFDATRLEITGEPVPVGEQVAYHQGQGRWAFSVSGGTLVYGTPEEATTQLIWFDRSGKSLGSIGGSLAYQEPALSRDGKTIVAGGVDPETNDQDLWLIDTARVGMASRFTSFRVLNFMPVWSPDATRIVFASPRDGPPNLFLKTLTGDTVEERLFKSSFQTQPTDWSPDGRLLVYAGLHPKMQWDLWLLPMTGQEAERRPVPFLQTEFNEHLARVSPDGRWIAYVSDETETDEVYVQPFPKPGVKRRISLNGGTDPRWRRDGTELFYVAADGNLMTVGVRSTPSFEASQPVALFKTRISSWRAGKTHFSVTYAVAGDGQRFLIDTVVEESKPVPTKVVLNWRSALRR